MRIIAGTLKGRRVELPKGSAARPTADRVREAVFNRLMPVMEGAYVLDMFAGSGAMGLEALSRGAEKAVFIELDKANARALTQNLTAFRLGEARARVYQGDALVWCRTLASDPARFDLVMIDPPYQAALYGQALMWADKLLAPGGIAVVEHEKPVELPPIPGLTLEDQRRYGRSWISWYRKDNHEPMDLPGQL